MPKTQPARAWCEIGFKAPNELRLERDTFKKEALDKYKSRRRSFHLYQAAARLWSFGVDWERALGTVKEAFDAVIVDE